MAATRIARSLRSFGDSPGSALMYVSLWCSLANTKKRFVGSWHIERSLS